MVANMTTKKDNHKVYSNSQLDGMEALNETIDSILNQSAEHKRTCLGR